MPVSLFCARVCGCSARGLQSPRVNWYAVGRATYAVRLVSRVAYQGTETGGFSTAYTTRVQSSVCALATMACACAVRVLA